MRRPIAALLALALTAAVSTAMLAAAPWLTSTSEERAIRALPSISATAWMTRRTQSFSSTCKTCFMGMWAGPFSHDHLPRPHMKREETP